MVKKDAPLISNRKLSLVCSTIFLVSYSRLFCDCILCNKNGSFMLKTIQESERRRSISDTTYFLLGHFMWVLQYCTHVF